jgi:hypothetical protein
MFTAGRGLETEFRGCPLLVSLVNIHLASSLTSMRRAASPYVHGGRRSWRAISRVPAACRPCQLSNLTQISSIHVDPSIVSNVSTGFKKLANLKVWDLSLPGSVLEVMLVNAQEKENGRCKARDPLSLLSLSFWQELERTSPRQGKQELHRQLAPWSRRDRDR